MSKGIRVLLVSVSSVLTLYVILGGILGKSDTSTSSSSEKAYRDLGVYQEVLDRIKIDYVTDPNLKNVTDGAIRGLLDALDPYSTYLTPAQYQDYLAHPNPGPAGVGLFVSKRAGFATVIAVLPGSPAEKAGVKAGDLVDGIDNAAIREMSVLQLQRLLAGASGTTVSMTVVREARGTPQKLTMTRAILSYPPVESKVLDDGSGYIRVNTFNKGKAKEIEGKLQEFKSKGVSKLVLDLRNCAEGDEPEASQTASLFLDKGLIGYLAGQRYPRQDILVKAAASTFTAPLVVLINQSTAGPAELLASAILDNKRGEVVGTRSFGMGVYQQLIPVGDGSALVLSVAKYYRPSGKAIEGNGVTPSVVQTANAEAAANPDDDNDGAPSENQDGKSDQQLRKALEILNKGTPAASKAA
jgi:carboxyl-terminal processing protease